MPDISSVGGAVGVSQREAEWGSDALAVAYPVERAEPGTVPRAQRRTVIDPDCRSDESSFARSFSGAYAETVHGAVGFFVSIYGTYAKSVWRAV